MDEVLSLRLDGLARRELGELPDVDRLHDGIGQAEGVRVAVLVGEEAHGDDGRLGADDLQVPAVGAHDSP